MSIAFDPSSDMTAIVDGLQTVALRRRGSSATVVAGAFRCAARTREETTSDGHYTASDVRWHLPRAACPDSPRVGDTICDAAGDYWTVLHVLDVAQAARWQCTCRNLAIEHGLDDVITIDEAVYEKGESGAVAISWRTWRTGVRARIQPVAAAVDADGDALRTVKKYRIFLAEDLNLDHHHRIRAADGRRYRVTGRQGSDRIGDLPVIEAEEES